MIPVIFTLATLSLLGSLLLKIFTSAADKASGALKGSLPTISMYLGGLVTAYRISGLFNNPKLPFLISAAVLSILIFALSINRQIKRALTIAFTASLLAYLIDTIAPHVGRPILDYIICAVYALVLLSVSYKILNIGEETDGGNIPVVLGTIIIFSGTAYCGTEVFFDTIHGQVHSLPPLVLSALIISFVIPTFLSIQYHKCLSDRTDAPDFIPKKKDLWSGDAYDRFYPEDVGAAVQTLGLDASVPLTPSAIETAFEGCLEHARGMEEVCHLDVTRIYLMDFFEIVCKD